jgi:hypothetical protein
MAVEFKGVSFFQIDVDQNDVRTCERTAYIYIYICIELWCRRFVKELSNLVWRLLYLLQCHYDHT